MVTQATNKKRKSHPAAKPTTPKVPPAVIECGHSYSLKEFRRRTGFTFETVRQMRASGLRVVKVGNEHWVRGDDYHSFLGQSPTVDEQRQSHDSAPQTSEDSSTGSGG